MPDLKDLNKPAGTLKQSTVGQGHVARLSCLHILEHHIGKESREWVNSQIWRWTHLPSFEAANIEHDSCLCWQLTAAWLWATTTVNTCRYITKLYVTATLCYVAFTTIYCQNQRSSSARLMVMDSICIFGLFSASFQKIFFRIKMEIRQLTLVVLKNRCLLFLSLFFTVFLTLCGH